MCKVLILEDNRIQRKALSDIIRQCSSLYRVYEADHVAEAVSIARRVQIDLFFVDIGLNDLKGGSGLRFAEKIRKMKNYRLTWIVFVTIHKEYMFTAFRKVHCYDYIVKPYDKAEIQKMTGLLLSESREEGNAARTRREFIIVPVKNIQVKIFTDEIIFVEVFLRTSVIHTIHDSFAIDYLSLKKLKSMITDKDILQSHRSYLVNITYISKIEKSNDRTSYRIYFYQTEKTALLGYNYRQNVMDQFHKLCGWKEDE